MELIKKYKNELVFFGILIVALCVAGIIISLTNNKETNEKPIPNIDVSDVNNIEAVESRLEYKMKITQGYLLTYTTNKSGVWYMSNALVSKIKNDDGIAYITLSNQDKTHTIIAEIDSSKVTIKKGDFINFVGTIDLETGHIELAKLSKEAIKYNDVTEIEFSKLVDNIKTVKDNIFVINGYMVTDGSKYKLYDTKSAYQDNKNVGNYFTISWKDKFDYTGNANVTLECKLNGTYKLKDCTLIK